MYINRMTDIYLLLLLTEAVLSRHQCTKMTLPAVGGYARDAQNDPIPQGHGITDVAAGDKLVTSTDPKQCGHVEMATSSTQRTHPILPTILPQPTPATDHSHVGINNSKRMQERNTVNNGKQH